jgi:hypothetical protein
MNAELRKLLQSAGIGDANDPGLWKRAVMLHVAGLLPPPPDLPNANKEAGFHLILLDESGNVVHRVKCRAADDEFFQRECDILAALRKDPELVGLVPQVYTAASPHLRIHVSRQLSGESYLTVIRTQRVSDWQCTVEEVLADVHKIGDRAKHTVPWLHSSNPAVSLSEALEHRFEQLEKQEIDAAAIVTLRAALEGVSVPYHPQHGDLWPGNIIKGAQGRWCVIDYETFGQVKFPLYDAYHLVWSSGHVTGRFRTWAGKTSRESVWRQARNDLLDGAVRRYGLSDRQAGALRLAFMIELTAHRMRPGAPPAYSRDLRAELCRMAQQLASGLDPADLAPAAQARTAMP